MWTRKPIAFAVASALGVSGGGVLSSVAVGQEVEGEEYLEEIVTTGTRIKAQDGFGRTSPVTVMTSDDISSLGLTRVEDVLNSLPSVETALHSFDANGISGTASIDLRGLGAERTLVLLNGRRMQPGGVQATPPDVNQIPAAMVERIEVLTGGASATYGADAVAGVVNFIMRRVNGVEISVGASGYQHNNDNGYLQPLMDARNFDYPDGDSGIGGEAYNIDLIVGSDFAGGNGNATAYATWRMNEEMLQAERDYGSCALSNDATVCGGSANAIVPNFFISPAVNGVSDYSQSEFLTLNPDGSLTPYDGSNVYNYAPINHFMRPDERWSFGALVDYDLNDNHTVYFEGNYATDRTEGQIAESGTFFAEEYFLPLDNPLFPQAFRDSLTTMFPGYDEFGVYIGKRNVEGGPRASNFQHDGFRVVAGIRGNINDSWEYDASYLYGQTDSSMAYVNDFFAPRIRPAVNGDVCAATAGCIPYEVFTYEGVTPEQAAPLLGTAVMTGKTATEVMNAYVTGDTGFTIPTADSSILVVGGWEHRIEEYRRISDSVFQDGSLLGQGGPTPSVDGSYTVTEFFAEANIPLINGATLAEDLTLDVAYRYSDYSSSGDANTYRFGFDWAPFERVRMRAGFNRAVRAPNVAELFSTQALGLWSGNDPCAGATPAYTAAQCANTGVTAAQYGNITASPAGQYNGIFGGNPNLEPEEADTLTVGFVVDPLDTLTISVDYWNIEITNAIDNIGATTILEQCGLYNVLCNQIVRNAGGSLWQGTQGYVFDTDVNLGQDAWEGVDLAASWDFEGLGGSWNANLIGTYMLTKETTPLPADPGSAYDCVGLASTRCFASPEWRHTASLRYDSNEWWAVEGRWRYFGGVDYDGSTDTIAQDELSSSQSYFDLNAVFGFLDNSDITIGVNNVLDEEPPMVGGTLTTNANTYAGFYDTLGRFLFAKATMRF